MMLLPSRPSSSSVAPRADRERLRVGPRNVPERDDRRVGQPVADHPRQQREVVVLHQDDGILGLGFRHDRVGEPRVDGAIVLEVARAERRAHVRDVAERPQALVGESRVVPVLFLRREPDPADLVDRMLGRHRDPIVAVDGLAVGGAAAVRDPGARARAHHRLERGHEAARRTLQADAVRCLRVDVRLAVRHDDDVVAVELAAQRRAERLLVPDALAAVERAVLSLEIADELAQVARDRAQLRRRRRAGRAQDALAAQQRAQALHPAAPRQLGDHHGDERDRRAQRAEEVEQVPAGLLAAARDEAHVVDEHQLGAGEILAVDRECGDVQRPARGLQHPFPVFRIGVRPERRTVDLAREVGASRWARTSRRGRARRHRAARPAASD